MNLKGDLAFIDSRKGSQRVEHYSKQTSTLLRGMLKTKPFRVINNDVKE